MSVQTTVVMDTIVGRIVELVRAASPSGGLDDAGWELRNVEQRLFEPARRPMPGLRERLLERMAGGESSDQAIAALSRELADAEPLERPDPGDGQPASWTVPGPGGHVRHYAAVDLAGAAGPERKRDVMCGYFRRCCEEALADA